MHVSDLHAVLWEEGETGEGVGAWDCDEGRGDDAGVGEGGEEEGGG